eukprot:5182853-Prymnesium_polylepis.1
MATRHPAVRGEGDGCGRGGCDGCGRGWAACCARLGPDGHVVRHPVVEEESTEADEQRLYDEQRHARPRRRLDG